MNNLRQLVKLDGSLISSNAVLNLHYVTTNVKSVTKNIVADGTTTEISIKLCKSTFFQQILFVPWMKWVQSHIFSSRDEKSASRFKALM
jgi:hypothetical protein